MAEAVDRDHGAGWQGGSDIGVGEHPRIMAAKRRGKSKGKCTSPSALPGKNALRAPPGDLACPVQQPGSPSSSPVRTSPFHGGNRGSNPRGDARVVISISRIRYGFVVLGSHSNGQIDFGRRFAVGTGGPARPSINKGQVQNGMHVRSPGCVPPRVSVTSVPRHAGRRERTARLAAGPAEPSERQAVRNLPSARLWNPRRGGRSVRLGADRNHLGAVEQVPYVDLDPPL